VPRGVLDLRDEVSGGVRASDHDRPLQALASGSRVREPLSQDATPGQAEHHRGGYRDDDVLPGDL